MIQHFTAAIVIVTMIVRKSLQLSSILALLILAIESRFWLVNVEDNKEVVDGHKGKIA